MALFLLAPFSRSALVPLLDRSALVRAAHWIVLAEERWCMERFGEACRQYIGRVRHWC